MTQAPPDILKNWYIIAIDDEADSLKVIEIVLTHYGATVAKATNGLKALELLQGELPDFIVCDLSMPVMDGWQFMEHLRSNSDTQAIPVIALTAHSMASDRQSALDAGFQAFLTKPFMPSTFIDDLLEILITIPPLAPRLKS